MVHKIRVAVLDDHQGIIDGYLYRLAGARDIEVTATALYGEALEPLLAQNAVDVLLLDVQVPTSPDNPNPYPILYLIPRLLEIYTKLSILVISMHLKRALIQAVMDAGANGYVLKDDQNAIRDLATIIRMIANGGIYLSQTAYQLLRRRAGDELAQPLSPRQLEALSLGAAYPEASEADLAQKMHIMNSSLRTLLSGAYLRLGVRTRIAAIAKARQIGLLSSDSAARDVPAIDGSVD